MTSKLADLSLEEKRQLLEQLLARKRQELFAAPLSFSQRGLWFIDQVDPGSIIHNVWGGVRIKGRISHTEARRALDELVRRHESLRTTFRMAAGEPVQVIGPPQPAHLEILDERKGTAEEKERRVRELFMREAHRTFDVTRNPLFVCTLIRLAEEEQVCMLSMHHIISDGWSMGILLRELGILYDAFLRGAPSPLPKLPIQYRDYTLWFQNRFKGAFADELAQYWKERLCNAPFALELPTDRPRPARPTYKGRRIEASIDSLQVAALRRLGVEQGATLLMVLLAAFTALLHRLTSQDDIVVGMPVAERDRPETQMLVGFLVNLLAIRTTVSGNPTFLQHLHHVREVVLGALEHHEMPFEALIQIIRPQRGPRPDPLIQVVFALQNMPLPALEFPGLTLERVDYDTGVAGWDIGVECFLTRGQLLIRWAYRQELFDDTTVERMMRQYLNILEAVTRNPGQRFSELPLLTSTERAQLLTDWNQTASPYSNDLCLHELVEQRVTNSPDAIALLSEAEHWTYRDLEHQANRFAHYLRRVGAPHTDGLVGICLENSPNAIVALLAILKTGSGYMPLDPRYPPARLARMIAAGDVRTIVTRTDLAAVLRETSARLVCIDSEREAIARESTDRPAKCSTGADLAYVIFTSGSTGEPKGVMVEHRSVVNLVRSFLLSYTPGTKDRVLQQTSLSFDASVGEIFPVLAGGGALVFPPVSSTMDVDALVETVKRFRVTILGAVPSVLAQLDLRAAELPSVRLVLSGGEKLFYSQVDNFVRTSDVTNAYGPTETTVCSLFHTVDPSTDYTLYDGRIPIGRPVINTRVYVLDQYLNPVPVNVSGELYIAGAGLARGYLNDPVQTAERFLPDPFVTDRSERMYRTGDLVRVRSNGALEFLGRYDSQVKIRGLRIEIDEILALLKQHPSVADAAVVPTTDPSERRMLVAYFVPAAGSHVSGSELRKHLQAKLPGYMIPSHFRQLQIIPRTAGGKVDHAELQTIATERPDLDQEFVAPRNDDESILAGLWSQALHLDKVGIYDDFFGLGGHSLLAAQLITQINERFRVSVPLRTMLETPNIAGLAETIAAAKENPSLRRDPQGIATPSLVQLRGGSGRGSVFCVHHIGGPIHVYRPFADKLSPHLRVYGIQSRALVNPDLEYGTLAEMVDAYAQAITVQRAESVHLVGYSSGGWIALATAAMLEEQGAPPQTVTLIDTHKFTLDTKRIHDGSLEIFILTARDSFPEEFSFLGDAVDTLLSQSHDLYDQLLPLSDEERIEFLFRSLGQFQVPNWEEVQRALRSRLQLYHHHYRLLQGYVPPCIGSPLYVCLADTPLPGEKLERGLDWSKHTTGKFKIENVSGNHFSIMKTPAVEQVAALMNAWLKDAAEKRTPAMKRH